MIFNNTDGEKYTAISFRESDTEYAQMRATPDEFAIYHNTGILKMNGNTVLNASNYTNYTVPKTGGTFSGNVIAPTFIGNLTGTADKALTSVKVLTKNSYGYEEDKNDLACGLKFYANAQNNNGFVDGWGMPSSFNANGILSIHTHNIEGDNPTLGNYTHLLGFSSNGKLYHKSRNTDSYNWYEIVEAKGTSTQFIKGDGTLDSTEYATKEDVEDSGTYWEYL